MPRVGQGEMKLCARAEYKQTRTPTEANERRAFRDLAQLVGEILWVCFV